MLHLGLIPSLEGPTAPLGLSSGRKEPLPPEKGPHFSISMREMEHTPKQTFPGTGFRRENQVSLSW